MRRCVQLIFITIINFIIFNLINGTTYPHAQKQDLRFYHLTTENGLSNASVHVIFQDSKGFLWFGTEGGLNRFDGYNFKTYFHNSEDTASISNDFVRSICEDDYGNLWIGTDDGGLNYFNVEQQQFVCFLNDTLDNDNTERRIFAVNNSVHGGLWIGSYGGGLHKLTFSEEVNNGNIKLSAENIRANVKFKQFKHDSNNHKSLHNNHIYGMFEDKTGILWLATDFGGRFPGALIKIISDKSGNNLDFTNYSVENTGFGSTSPMYVYSTQDGKIWVSSWGGGLNEFNLETEKFTPYKNDPKNQFSISSNNTYCMIEDIYKNFWISTYGGGINIMPFNKPYTFVNYKNDPNDQYSLSSNQIKSAIFDRSGNFWLGTLQNGIDKIRFRKQFYQNYEVKDINVIFSAGSGNIWIGSPEGLYKFDPQKGKTISIFNKKNNVRNLPDYEIITICEDKFGNLWMGTRNGYLYKYDKNKNFTNYNNAKILEYFSLYKDKNGQLWGAGSINDGEGQLFRILTDDKANYLKYDVFSENELFVTQFSQNNNEILLVEGRWGGHRELNLATGKLTEFKNVEEFMGRVENTSLCSDKKGNIWIGTKNLGLVKYNPKKQRIKKYTEKDGLPSDYITGILEDDKGNLWISTYKSLSKLDPDNEKFINYNIDDGLHDNCFSVKPDYTSVNTFTKDKNGFFYFANNKGFTYFHPDSISENKQIPPIVITELRVFNKVVKVGEKVKGSILLTKEISETKEIAFTQEQNSFSIEFAALDYTNPKKNKYAYKLEPFEKEWNYVIDRRFVNYTGLPPGEYTFKVIGTNCDGIWNKEGTSLHITIIPPWWKTTWFMIIVVLTVLTIIVSFYKIRTKAIKRQNIYLERTVNERTQEIRDKNVELQNQQQEIITQNEELIQHREEIITQKESIEKQNTELEKLSIVASETDNAVMIMDAEGNFEWVNEGFIRMNGCNLEEHIEKKGKNMLEASSNSNIKKILKKCINKKKSVIYESKAVHVSGTETWLQTTLTPIFDSDNNVIRLIAIDSDISKLKDAEEEIKGSIRYAKTIQNAILPNVDNIKEHFESFILFRPKDIVSGDFYKYTYSGGYHFVIVVDCTGHGVPGAFMSMIGNSLLNEIINEKQIYDPSEILVQLNTGVVNSLQQEHTDNKDGMDVCLCRIKKGDKTEVVFSGAKRDLIYYNKKDSKIEINKGERKSIGGPNISRNKSEFVNNKLILSEGDILYLTSDGLIDQNNKERKRFGLLHFNRVLKENAEKPLSEQNAFLGRALDDWQKDTVQRDDITVLGIKI